MVESLDELGRDYGKFYQKRKRIENAFCLLQGQKDFVTIGQEQELVGLLNELGQIYSSLRFKLKDITTIQTLGQDVMLWQGRLTKCEQDFLDAQKRVKQHLGRRAAWRGRQGGDDGHEQGKIASAEGIVDDILKQGSRIYTNLVEQNSTLKAAQRKIFDFSTSAGISDMALRSAASRQRFDRWLAYGGVMLLVLITFFLVYYLK